MALHLPHDTDRAGVGAMTVNGRILIVEDDAHVREMLAEYLRTHGYEVVVVDQGAAMREAVEKTCPTSFFSTSIFPAKTASRSRGSCASAMTSASSS